MYGKFFDYCISLDGVNFEGFKFLCMYRFSSLVNNLEVKMGDYSRV